MSQDTQDDKCAVCSCGNPSFIIKSAATMQATRPRVQRFVYECECTSCGKHITIRPANKNKLTCGEYA